MEEILHTIKLNNRDKALLEYILANYPVVHNQEVSQSVIDYNQMLGVLQDPLVEANMED